MKKAILCITALTLLLAASGCEGKLPPNTMNSNNDLQNANVGIVEHSSSSILAAGNGTIHTYASAETVLVDLRNGAIDSAVLEKTAAQNAMKTVHGLKIKTELIRAELCFAVAKENPDLRADINTALSALKESETLKKMISGYFGGESFQYTSPSGVDRSKGTLTMAVDGQLRPYAYDDGTGKIVGFDVDLARAVCDYLRLDLKIIVVDRAELLKTVQFGKADFAMGCLYPNDGDNTLVDFSDSYLDCTQVIVVRK